MSNLIIQQIIGCSLEDAKQILNKHALSFKIIDDEYQVEEQFYNNRIKIILQDNIIVHAQYG